MLVFYNINNFIKDLSMHVININKALKNMKLSVIANFIHVNNKGIVITTNNIASLLDLQVIEKYFKSTICIETDHVESPRLLQSKPYLKIIGIPYLSKHTNSCIISNDVKKILKSNHIFNDIVLVSNTRIIKVSSKSDMSIIWINIWDTQSRSKVKCLINRRFNVGSFIITICGANMSPDILQCKNCWKQGYSTDVCKIQDAKCVKYSSPYQTIHHCEFTWYCKANNKINPSRLEKKRVSHACTPSSVQTVKENTKQT